MFEHDHSFGNDDRPRSRPERHDTIEVRDADHFDSVVRVLHRAPTGRLRTSTGNFEVKPLRIANPHGDNDLFDLEFLDGEGPNLDDLQIDELELSFGDVAFTMDGASINARGGTLRVCRPQHLYSHSQQLVAVPAGKAQLFIQWWEDAAVDLRIHGLSMDALVAEGIDFDDADPFPRSAWIEFIEHEGVPPVRIDCTVAVHGVSPSCPRHIHLSIEFVDDRAELTRIYRLLRFPRLFDRGAMDAEDVVELFRRSGYLDLRKTDNSDNPTDKWCCPDFAYGLSVDTTYQAVDGQLLGHVSVTRAYPNTWLGHQLTTLKGHDESAECRVALYHHFASVPLLNDGEDSFLLGYYDRSKRWHRLFFEAFVDWMGDASQAMVLPFDRFEPAESDAPRRRMRPSNAVIHAAGSAELPEATELVRSQLSPLAIEAFAINELDLKSEYLHPEYEQRGIDRSREVLVMYEHGKLVGVALCETGNRHLSLFNLLNFAQVYVSQAHPPSRSAKASLLRRVRGFYAARGVTDPVIAALPGTFDQPGDADLRLDETMGCIIWAGSSLEQYQSYIRYCFERIGATSLLRKTAV